ncbi:hypothetical protein BH10PSE2_BH10PSE2_07380 [soil metagenome]
MPDPTHPEGPGTWTLLQDHVDHLMWQQDETDSSGRTITRFWILNPPETLTYETYDEAEAMFLRIGDDGDTWAGEG